MRLDKIPLFLEVDVEPDQDLNAGPRGPVSWTGFGTIRRHFEDLRGPLGDSTGSPLRIGWHLRMDPQIEALCGAANHSARLFGDDVAQLSENGDYLGLHVHATRWDDAQARWVLDRHDPDLWFEHLKVGLEAFASSMGAPPLRHKYTRSLTSERIVALLARSGVRVDLTPEARPGRYFGRTPRQPYQATVPPETAGLWVLPGNSGFPHGGSALRKWARRVRHGPFSRWSLHPYRPQQTPKDFWDEMARSCRSMPIPYVAIAFRTNAEGDWVDVRQRALLDALVAHPFARALRFADPLELVPRNDVSTSDAR